jgi:serine/threonine protein kinase
MLLARHPDPLAVGSVLRDRFELIEIIGRGGISTVYRAADRTRLLAQMVMPDVAVKLTLIEGEHSSWAIERVHREGRYLRELRHPNIVEVFDTDYDGAFHYLVLEMLEGRTLTDILRSQPGKALPLHLAVRITASIGAALTHAHAHGISHRDVKPNNVFITFEGFVKLLDFGSACSLDPRGPEQSWTPGRDDYHAMTPLFASLEMMSGDTPTESDDVFSLAVLAYVMLAGTHPFGGISATEALALGIRPQRPPTLSRTRWRALDAALALDREDRTATIPAFIRDFAQPLWRDRLFG